ncbi:hypothetical protein HPP92_006838 [Vanilla planifolia]|uniref:Uncharacterized protein n=1 Tax=Vanilla planifolia TaxID=51239 RepID=A0A835RKM6_VANPL|nr:hypothetical protein HPP92_006838 [Vanilla planifolia]
MAARTQRRVKGMTAWASSLLPRSQGAGAAYFTPPRHGRIYHKRGGAGTSPRHSRVHVVDHISNMGLTNSERPQGVVPAHVRITSSGDCRVQMFLSSKVARAFQA